jgi:hypothetical protein
MRRPATLAMAALLLVVVLAGCSDFIATPLPTTVPAVVVVQDRAEAAMRADDANATVAEKDTSFEAQDARVESTEAKEDVAWGAIYLKADVEGIHYNLNQPAKAADALADDWSLVFSQPAPFRAEDAIHFCGPAKSFGVQVLDAWAGKLLVDATVSEVPACE